MEWVDDKSMFGSGILGKSGKWVLFNIFYDGCVSRDKEEKYKLKCFLPGIKDNLGHFLKEKEAKEKAEKVLKYWIENLKED